MKKKNRLLILVGLQLIWMPLLIADNLSDVVHEFSEQMENQENLCYTASLEYGKGKVQDVSLYFSSQAPLNVEGARRLIQKVTDQFLTEVNSRSGVKEDLSDYPMSVNQLEITVFFRNNKGKYASFPQVAQVMMSRGLITYYKYQNGNFEIIHQENFQKAVSLINCESVFDQTL